MHDSPSGLPSSGLHTRKVAPAFSTHQTLARGFSMRCPPSSWDGRQERSSFSTRHDPSGASTPAAWRALAPLSAPCLGSHFLAGTSQGRSMARLQSWESHSSLQTDHSRHLRQERMLKTVHLRFWAYPEYWRSRG